MRPCCNLPPRYILGALAAGHLLAAGASSQGEASPGLTLYAPVSTASTHLMDSTGQTLNTWPSTSTPGLSVYLLPNGNLLRAEHPPGAGSGPGGGPGGRVREIDWEGNVLWSFDYFDFPVLHHHDIEPMPNGNVLMIAWEEFSNASAVQAGRDPGTVGTSFYPDHIIEVQPTGATSGTIVWEWHAWDHLIQDFDATKDNFGVVADHPELIDINYPPGFDSDWTHINSIDYNAELDQILLSVHDLDEVWIIDHSTTTAEAAGHTGGNSGKGGDLLYRWGNPEAYGAGTPADHILGGQHDANWVEDGSPGAGNIVLFNNFSTAGPSVSSVVEFVPPVDEFGGYPLAPGQAFGPAGVLWEYTAPAPTSLFSPIMSGAIRLANGNTLVTSAVQGRIFEVTPDDEVVWEQTGLGTVFKAGHYARNLWSADRTLSLSAGGDVQFDLVAGDVRAGDLYFVLGSVTGTEPALPLGSIQLPLVFDPYFLLTLKGSAPLAGNLGVLDGQGKASFAFGLLPDTAPSLAGIVVHHSVLLADPDTFEFVHATNPESFELVR